jgi:hypothetical protein
VSFFGNVCSMFWLCPGLRNAVGGSLLLDAACDALALVGTALVTGLDAGSFRDRPSHTNKGAVP